MAHPRAKPIGSTRLHDTGNGVYRLVKIAPTGRWPYEHRVVMEATIGRPLERNEHVHHLNHDTLDNRPENLVLLSASEHRKEHHALVGRWTRDYDACVICGEATRRHASRGRCSRCYQRLSKDKG